jgi:hypothetical protein
MCESSPEDLLIAWQRRRAQNRKAQQAFRERKEKAIQRLEKEVEKLKALNHNLNSAHEARLREIADLKVELESQSRESPSPPSIPYFDEWDEVARCQQDLSTVSSTSSPTSPPVSISASEPVVSAMDGMPSWIKWRGRIYVDNEALAKAVVPCS